MDRNLDINPLVQGQEDRLRIRLEEIVLRIHVDAETGWRVVPEGEALVEAEDMVIVASYLRVPLVSVSAHVLQPERGRVANVALSVQETRNADTSELSSTGPVERRDPDLLGGN